MDKVGAYMCLVDLAVAAEQQGEASQQVRHHHIHRLLYSPNQTTA